MIQIPHPQVADSFGSAFFDRAKVIYPISLSIDESITPVSTASMVMPRSEIYGRNHVFKLFKVNGLAGYYRIRSSSVDYNNDTVTYELEHMIAEVGDWCILQKHSGSYTAANAIRRLWRGSDASSTSDDSYRGSHWQLGSLSWLTETVELDAENRSNLLSSMLDVLDGLPDIFMTFDFSVYPWTVDFASLSNNVLNVDVKHGRLSRNIGSAQVSLDYTDLCTRVRYYYDSWHYNTADEAHISQYGIVESKVDVSDADSSARAQYIAKEYLRKNQEPRISISMSGEDLYSITGVPQDKFELGRYFSLFVPELGADIVRNITRLTWNDVYGDPLSVSVTLGEEDPSLWAYLKKIKKK